MAEKFLYPGFEREQMLNEAYECSQCLEPITNPICHSCLGNEINKWMSFYPNIKKKMMPKIKSFVKEVNNSALSDLTCISCSKSKAALCPYCFSEEIFNILKRSKIDRMIIMDFLSTFNFDLKHEGYIQDATREGLY